MLIIHPVWLGSYWSSTVLFQGTGDTKAPPGSRRSQVALASIAPWWDLPGISPRVQRPKHRPRHWLVGSSWSSWMWCNWVAETLIVDQLEVFHYFSNIGSGSKTTRKVGCFRSSVQERTRFVRFDFHIPWALHFVKLLRNHGFLFRILCWAT